MPPKSRLMFLGPSLLAEGDIFTGRLVFVWCEGDFVNRAGSGTWVACTLHIEQFTGQEAWSHGACGRAILRHGFGPQQPQTLDP